MARVDTKWIPEKGKFDYTLNETVVDTTGLTVYAYAYDSSGTQYQLSSINGAAAGTPLAFTGANGLDFSAVPLGRLTFEVIANPGDTNPVPLMPNQTYKKVVLWHGDFLGIS